MISKIATEHVEFWYDPYEGRVWTLNHHYRIDGNYDDIKNWCTANLGIKKFAFTDSNLYVKGAFVRGPVVSFSDEEDVMRFKLIFG